MHAAMLTQTLPAMDSTVHVCGAVGLLHAGLWHAHAEAVFTFEAMHAHRLCCAADREECRSRTTAAAVHLQSILAQCSLLWLWLKGHYRVC